MKKNKPSLTLGSDPELMLVDRSTGRIVSSLNVIKQNKHNPIDLGDGIRTYADNVLVEAAFPPSRTVGEVVETLQEAFRRIQTKALGQGYELLPRASHHYEDLPPRPDDEIVLRWLEDKSGGIQIAEEWQVGCKPNWDCYAFAQRKQFPFQDGLRTGSFHIHVGNANYRDNSEELLLTPQSKVQAVKLMDIFVGCASIVFDRDDTSAARRALYGRAGEFRPTSYGIEYRVLSNYALRTPELATLVFDLTEFAIKTLARGDGDSVLKSISPLMVQEAINTNNKTIAQIVLMKSGLPWKLMQRIVNAGEATDFYNAWEIAA